MSFIDSLKKQIFQDTSSIQQKGANTSAFSFFAPSAMPQMGEKEYLQAYTSWVYACTNAIAERVADIDLKLQTKSKSKWEDFQGQHPALQLLHDVNGFMSFYDLVLNYQSFQELNGNTFWWMRRNGGKQIAEIWPMDPTKMQVVKDGEKFIRGYVFVTEKGEKIPFDVEDIIHFKRFNPVNAYRGVGTVKAAAIPVDIDTYASEYQRNFFGNSAMPSGILATKDSLTQDQFDRIKSNWDSKFKGVQNAHKMALLEAGLEWTPLTPTAREMQFADSRKNIRDEILAIFRVPKPILGILEDVNLASADAADLLFNKNVIKPKMKFFVTKLTEFYLPLYGLDQSEWRFWFTDPIPENLDQKRLDRESGLTHGYLTPNEARAEIGLKPIAGGDELFIPNNMMPIAQALNPQDASEDDTTPEDNEVDDTAKGVKKNFRVIKGKKLEKSEEATQREQAYKDEQTKELHKTFLDLNVSLEKLLLKRLKQYKAIDPNKTKEPSGLITRLYKQITKDQVGESNDVANWLFDNEAFSGWIKLVYNATEKKLKEIFNQAGLDTFADFDLEGSFDLQNPRALDWINENALKDSTSYSDTMKEDIALKVQEGIELGLSNEEIAGNIKQFFTDQSSWRAMRVARSETITAYSNGNLEGYKQSGIISGKYWITDGHADEGKGGKSSGEQPCVDNEEAGVIPLDQAFPSGHQAPGAHSNCECALGAVTDQSA